MSLLNFHGKIYMVSSMTNSAQANDIYPFAHVLMCCFRSYTTTDFN